MWLVVSLTACGWLQKHEATLAKGAEVACELADLTVCPSAGAVETVIHVLEDAKTDQKPAEFHAALPDGRVTTTVVPVVALDLHIARAHHERHRRAAGAPVVCSASAAPVSSAAPVGSR